MKLTPKKPRIIIAQVAGSGMAAVSDIASNEPPYESLIPTALNLRLSKPVPITFKLSKTHAVFALVEPVKVPWETPSQKTSMPFDDAATPVRGE